MRTTLAAVLLLVTGCLVYAAAPGGPSIVEISPVRIGSGSATGPAIAGTAEAAGTVKPIEVRRQQVMQILRSIQPHQQNTRAAEVALAAAGKENLPVLQELKDHPDRLVGDDELTTSTYTTTDGLEITDSRPREARAKDLSALRLKVVETVINQFVPGSDPAAAGKRAGDKPPTPGWPLKNDSLTKLFPDYAFQSRAVVPMPVARSSGPENSGHVYAIDRKDAVEDLTNTEALKGWFGKHLGAVKDEATAKTVMRAWMACLPSLVADSMYQFVLAEDTLVVEKTEKGLKVSGRLDVTPGAGNRGTVSATLTFDAEGKLGPVSQEVNLKPGIRPVCQSTKLLDPDPIVRRMAEDSLMIMGTEAFPYMIDQRSRSGPELQAAIDRMMERIINGD